MTKRSIKATVTFVPGLKMLLHRDAPLGDGWKGGGERMVLLDPNGDAWIAVEDDGYYYTYKKIAGQTDPDVIH